MSHKKFGPDRFSRFDVYWIQTNKQTDRKAKYIYIDGFRAGWNIEKGVHGGRDQLRTIKERRERKF